MPASTRSNTPRPRRPSSIVRAGARASISAAWTFMVGLALILTPVVAGNYGEAEIASSRIDAVLAICNALRSVVGDTLYMPAVVVIAFTAGGLVWFLCRSRLMLALAAFAIFIGAAYLVFAWIAPAYEMAIEGLA